MNLRSLFAVAAVAAAALPSHAATIVQWNFDSLALGTLPATSVTGATLAPVAASFGVGAATGTHASAATVYSTPAGNGSAKSLSANTWAVGDYWQFSFSTTGVTGLSLTFDQAGSGTGPSLFNLAYSLDGVSFTTFNTSPYAVVLSAFQSGSVQATPNPAQSFDLSSISALNNQSTVYVRLVDASTTSINVGTVAVAGTDRVDNFTVLGTVAAVPEPETYALMFAGLGMVGFMARRRKSVA